MAMIEPARPYRTRSPVGRRRLAAMAAVARDLPQATALAARRKHLLQQTALRVDDRSLFTEPMVIANAEHRFAIGEQLRAVGIDRPTIVARTGSDEIPRLRSRLQRCSPAKPIPTP